jgi:hypothetical protein
LLVGWQTFVIFESSKSKGSCDLNISVDSAFAYLPACFFNPNFFIKAIGLVVLAQG